MYETNTFLSHYTAQNGMQLRYREHLHPGETEAQMQARDADMGVALTAAFPIAYGTFLESIQCMTNDASEWARAQWWIAGDVLYQIGTDPAPGEAWADFVARWLSQLQRAVRENPPV